MKTLFDYANAYAKQCSWKDFALIKFCLCAIGIIIGVLLPKAGTKPALMIAGTVFIITYIPLMVKFIKLIIREKGRKREF